MKCLETQRLLDDLVDGTLPPERRGEVVRHLEGCEACRATEARLRALLDRAAALPRSIEPARDLWRGIEARIEAVEAGGERAGRARRRYRIAWAAGIAAVVIAAASIATMAIIGIGRTRTAPGMTATPAAMKVSTELAQAHAAFETARVQLIAALEARRGSLSPQTLEVVDHNLGIIDEAIANIRAAMETDPGNTELPALLVAIYRQEIDLLRQAAQLPARG